MTRAQFEAKVLAKHPDTPYRFFSEKISRDEPAGEYLSLPGKRELMYAIKAEVIARKSFESMKSIERQQMSDYITFDGNLIKQREIL